MVKNRLLNRLENIMEYETSSGIVLLCVTFITILWANSPAYETYQHFIHYPLGFTLGAENITHSLQHWVNDGLMVVFFFMVGLEIKREIVDGELSTPKKAALPMFAALGGMVVPALLYLAFNAGTPAAAGWGIPMATDIAFAVGILSLASKRVPFSLKVFLLALAIVDDLGAILVIAFFYTSKFSGSHLGLAAIVFFLIYAFGTAGIRNYFVYIILGVIAWYFILKSGIHATITGVIIGFLTPAKAFTRPIKIMEKIQPLFNTVSKDLETADKDHVRPAKHRTQNGLLGLSREAYEGVAPVDRLIHKLHPWVAFIIMPLFAITNAGVRLDSEVLSNLASNHISLGIIAGLFIGKPLGVLLASFIATRLGLAQLPEGVTWKHITALGFLAGVGFTMALFISHLALKVPEIEVYSKLGILIASILSAIVGLCILFSFKEEAKD